MIQHADLVKPEGVKAAPVVLLLSIALVFVAGFCSFLTLMPILFPSLFWDTLSCLPTTFLLICGFRLVQRHVGDVKPYALLLAFVASTISDLLLLILVRLSLKWITIRTSIPRIAGALAIQIAVVLLVFVVPYYIPIEWHPEMAKTGTGAALFSLAIFNLPTVVASLAFSISLLFVLIHRLTWPLLSEISYILTRNNVLEKRGALRFAGGILISYALHPTTSFWSYVVDKVLK
jgi:hypothetical protein